MISFVLTVGMFGGMLVLPLFLQNLRGLGAAESGLILMFQVLPMTIAMPLVGRLVDRVGARRSSCSASAARVHDAGSWARST